MSLTSSDLYQIRSIVKDEVRAGISPLSDKVEALENDVKEIYAMLSKQERNLRNANTNILTIAKHIGVSPPKKLIF